MTSAELSAKFGVPVYRTWEEVPKHLFTRTAAAKEKVKIPVEVQPDAIKNAASVFDEDKFYLLYDINKYKKSIETKKSEYVQTDIF